MEHGSSGNNDWRHGWMFWVITLGTLGVLGLGFLGHARYEQAQNDGHADFASATYHALQLLILHAPHLDHAVPPELHAARALSVVVVFLAGFLAFLGFFRQEWLLVRLRLRWWRAYVVLCGLGDLGRRLRWWDDHVVICGLGDLGPRLALDGRRRGRFVVAIEKSGNASVLEQARRGGVLVLEGNACEESTLRRARVAGAECLVAACADDHTNTAIAALAGQLLARRPASLDPLLVRLLIRNPKTRDVLLGSKLIPTGTHLAPRDDSAPRYRVNLSDLDYHATAARLALNHHALDVRDGLDTEPVREHDDTIVHLVVIGFGLMGRALMLQAARLCHFANEVGENILPRITIVDHDPSNWTEFKSRQKHLDEVCVAEFQTHDPSGTSFADIMAALGNTPNTRVTYAVCLEPHSEPDKRAENDRVNLHLSIELAGHVDAAVQTLVFQSTRCGYAALFPPSDQATVRHLHPFGMIEDIYAWDVLLHEAEDKLASRLHQFYLEGEKKKADFGSKPGHKAWAELPDYLKDSNRQAADHIRIKLRTLELSEEALLSGPELSTSQIELLAKMEHVRWCAEKWLDGWEYSPDRNNDKKRHDDLRAWRELPDTERWIDRDLVAKIKAALRETDGKS
ncbi:MAG: NAD-binding protein [Deltaproteobacteria bacterium]|nr:NAD-binding protein [Deltaproteobacteria bacterium]